MSLSLNSSAALLHSLIIQHILWADTCHSAFWPQTSKTGAMPGCTLSRAVSFDVATISLCSCRAPVNVQMVHVSMSRWICVSICIGVAVTSDPSLSSRDKPIAGLSDVPLAYWSKFNCLSQQAQLSVGRLLRRAYLCQIQQPTSRIGVMIYPFQDVV